MWYGGFSCAVVSLHPLPGTSQEMGIDLGLEAFAPLADGSRLLTSGYYRRAERCRAKCQRRVSKRKQGSHRQRKAVCWLSQAQQHVRRQRQAFHHKTVLALVRQYDTISHEDLQVRTMVKKRQRAKKRISDAGWGGFLAILSCTAAHAGTSVGMGDPILRSPARAPLAVASWCTRACPLVGTASRTEEPGCTGTITPRRTL